MPLKFPKPKKRKSKPTRLTKDGRLVLSKAAWNKLRLELWYRQEGICAGAIVDGKNIPCGSYVVFGPGWHGAHLHKRGMNSSTRDDRYVRGLCAPCHRKETEAADSWRTAKLPQSKYDKEDR